MRKDPDFYGDSSRTCVLNGPLKVIKQGDPGFEELAKKIEQRYGCNQNNTKQDSTKSQNN